MKVARAIAEMLKREGIKFIIGYPVNPIIEACAEAAAWGEASDTNHS